MALYGELIRTMRLSRGWSQEHLAELVGKKRSAIGNYEADKRRPDYETLEAFADVFNVPISTFFDRVEEDNEEMDELMQLRDELRRNPEMRTLFSLSRNATPGQLRQTIRLLEFIKKEGEQFGE